MVHSPEILKPAEAAVVAGVSVEAVNRAIDRKIVSAPFVQTGGRRGISLPGCALVTCYFATAKQLTAEERTKLLHWAGQRLKGRPKVFYTEAADDWRFNDEFLVVDFRPFLEATRGRWERLAASREVVVSDPYTLRGMPVLKGTRVPVHDIAASVAAGVPAARLRNAYPGLTSEQIELAVIYAQANPPQGRPRKAPIAGVKLVSEERVPRRLRTE